LSLQVLPVLPILLRTNSKGPVFSHQSSSHLTSHPPNKVQQRPVIKTSSNKVFYSIRSSDLPNRYLSNLLIVRPLFFFQHSESPLLKLSPLPSNPFCFSHTSHPTARLSPSHLFLFATDAINQSPKTRPVYDVIHHPSQRPFARLRASRGWS
jgi:hypothetical protein